jgi:glycerophosphoryl diester phosphodiesterase
MLSPLLSLVTPLVIAHRGGAGLAPENTLAAIDRAVELDVAIECDVHLSRDGQPVVIHDATLDRTTDATGLVSALTADELARVDAGCRFRDRESGRSYEGPRVGVPTLAEVLDRSGQLPMVIEIKGRDPSVVPAVLDVIAAHGANRYFVIGGFDEGVLQAVRRHAPDLPTSAAGGEVRRALYRAWFGLSPVINGYRLFQVPPTHHGRRVLTRRFARAARRAGLPVHAWVIDDPAQMHTLIAWGVTGIITDRPDLARIVVGNAARQHT